MRTRTVVIHLIHFISYDPRMELIQSLIEDWQGSQTVPIQDSMWSGLIPFRPRLSRDSQFYSFRMLMGNFAVAVIKPRIKIKRNTTTTQENKQEITRVRS
jgi:hypothetical protein